MHMCTHMCMCMCMCVHVYILRHIVISVYSQCTSVYVDMNRCIHGHNTYMYMCIHTDTLYVSLLMCTYVCMHLCTRPLCKHRCVHVYIFTNEYTYTRVGACRHARVHYNYGYRHACANSYVFKLMFMCTRKRLPSVGVYLLFGDMRVCSSAQAFAIHTPTCTRASVASHPCMHVCMYLCCKH